MAPQPYDLAVAYRIYPGVSKVPPIFPDDKYRLAAACLSSFKRSLGSLRTKLWVLLDGCPEEYQALFEAHFDRRDLEFHHLRSVGNKATFALQLDILCNQAVSELVYFAEDDYFYFPGLVENMCNFQRGNALADFVTPYDHPNAYAPHTELDSEYVTAFAGRHWRTIVSTCLTFLTTRTTLRRTRGVFESFSAGSSDYALWMSLTKYRRHILDWRRYRRSMERADVLRVWKYSWRQVLFGRRYHLWSPIPTIATHMERSHLSPTIDWHSLWQKDLGDVRGAPRE
jgi:hypothetical protein